MKALRRAPRNASRGPRALTGGAAWTLDPEFVALLSGLGVDWVDWPDADPELMVDKEPYEQAVGEDCDALVDAYLDWREALEAAEASYRACSGLRGAEAHLAFGAYVAALDGEEQAANVYRLLAGGAAAWAEPEPPEDRPGGRSETQRPVRNPRR